MESGYFLSVFVNVFLLFFAIFCKENYRLVSCYSTKKVTLRGNEISSKEDRTIVCLRFFLCKGDAYPVRCCHSCEYELNC